MSAISFTTTLQILLSIVGNGVNEQDQPIAAPQQNTASPGFRQGYTLPSGTDITLTPPLSPQPTAKWAIIALSDSTAVLLKGAAGDTGYQLGTQGPTVLQIGTKNGPDGNPGSFILHAAGQTPIVVWWC